MGKQLIFAIIIFITLCLGSTASALTVSWDQPPDDDLMDIQLFVCDEREFIAQVCKDPVATIVAPETSYDATGVVGPVWFMRILARDDSKNKSGWSNVIDNVNPGIPGGFRRVIEVEVAVDIDVNIN